MTRKPGAVLAVGVAALVLAACGHSAKHSPATATTTDANPAATGAAPGETGGTNYQGSSTVAPPGSGNAISVAGTSLGRIVVDGTGRTLYRFDDDTNKPSVSNCVGACLTEWPAVPYVAGLTVTGVASSLVGQLKRANGTVQLTIGGFPMYLFAGDSKAGDTRGQAIGGTWWAVAPTGARIGKAPVTAGPTKIGSY